MLNNSNVWKVWNSVGPAPGTREAQVNDTPGETGGMAWQ